MAPPSACGLRKRRGRPRAAVDRRRNRAPARGPRSSPGTGARRRGRERCRRSGGTCPRSPTASASMWRTLNPIRATQSRLGRRVCRTRPSRAVPPRRASRRELVTTWGTAASRRALRTTLKVSRSRAASRGAGRVATRGTRLPAASRSAPPITPAAVPLGPAARQRARPTIRLGPAADRRDRATTPTVTQSRAAGWDLSRRTRQIERRVPAASSGRRRPGGVRSTARGRCRAAGRSRARGRHPTPRRLPQCVPARGRRPGRDPPRCWWRRPTPPQRGARTRGGPGQCLWWRIRWVGEADVGRQQVWA
mmetsp:Transcript_45931/g.104110  ORF Transcript_45931/g.104110 Transcript_45931/m.104110 type:complete len:307 (+) Transcript_45931:1745-2665(+)